METIQAHGVFHAAHRQLGYDGKCAQVHGHTWRGKFVVRAQRFPRLDEVDMSVDFGALKDVFKSLDHKMLISGKDEPFLNAQLFDPIGIAVMPGANPSVENVALYCMNAAIDAIAKLFPGNEVAYELSVTIQETDNNIFTLDRKVVI